VLVTIGADGVQTVQYKNSNGATQTISFRYEEYSGPVTFSMPKSYVSTNPKTYMDVDVWAPSQISGRLLAELTLPNQLTYEFGYNAYSELTRIKYPSGGETKYGYTGTVFDVTSENLDRHYVCVDGPGFNNVIADFRQVLRKAETTTPGSNYAVTKYEPVAVSGPFEPDNACSAQVPHNNVSNTVYEAAWASNPPDDTRRNKTRHEFIPYGYRSGQVKKIDTYGGPDLLKTVEYDYTPVWENDYPLPLRVKTTLAAAPGSSEVPVSSRIEYTYDTYSAIVLNSHGAGVPALRYIDRPLTTVEYGYDNNVLRQTSNTWVKGDYATDHIFDLKATEDVRDTIASEQNPLRAPSKINYEYDNYQAFGDFDRTLLESLAVQLEAREYRGNLTKTERWRSTDGATLATLNQYDDAGNLRRTRDAGGHVTEYLFDDQWGDNTCQVTSAKAYPTTAKAPLNHTTTSKYNSCTGTLSSTTDVNQQVSLFSYDAMDRQSLALLQAGRRVETLYEDQARKITTKKLRRGSDQITTTREYDGLGRLRFETTCEDGPGCASKIITETRYDAAGRKECVSNPYRSQSDLTFGWTCYRYDALNRVVQVTPPDGQGGNVVVTTYSANTSTTTDQAGKARKIKTDAAGRLITVVEPGVQQ